MKKYSIIIPNTNSLLIHQIVHQLKTQTVDLSTVEILVVGVDEQNLVVEDEHVRFIATESPGFASDKRNLGMKLAQGELFFFLDDDCLPDADWLERHLYRHQQGELIVGGAVTFGSGNYLQLADNVSAFHDLLPFTAEGERPYLTTSNLSVNRSVVERAGLMEPHKNRAEDLQWTVGFRALGYRLYFEPKAIICHDPARCTPRAVWRHWTNDAPDTIRVRLRYAQLLQTPHLARYRSIFLWGAPCVATWATARTFANSQTFRQYWHTLPLVYLTKLAWCWGAFNNFPKNEKIK